MVLWYVIRTNLFFSKMKTGAIEYDNFEVITGP